MLKDRIRSTRLTRGYTMQETADALHVTLRNYQNYEGGQASPTLDGLVAFADIFNVPTDFLLGRDEYLKSLGVSVDVSPEGPPRRPKVQKTR